MFRGENLCYNRVELPTREVTVVENENFYETKRCRCLHFPQKLFSELYLCYCGIEECAAGQFFDATGREGWHLHVICSGKGTLELDGKPMRLHFGQLFITKPGESCRYYADETDPWSYCWMTFDGEAARRYVESAGFTEGVNVQDSGIDASQFYQLVSRVLENPEMSIANDMLSLGVLLEYLSLSIKSNYRARKVNRLPDEYSGEDYVTRAMTMLDGNFANIRISEVARNIGLNRSYLTTLFKKQIGISPKEYLVQRRVKYACDYLENTNLQFQEVARFVGYDDPLTFSKLFRKLQGVSPTEYRKQFHRETD